MLIIDFKAWAITSNSDKFTYANDENTCIGWQESLLKYKSDEVGLINNSVSSSDPTTFTVRSRNSICVVEWFSVNFTLGSWELKYSVNLVNSRSPWVPIQKTLSINLNHSQVFCHLYKHIFLDFTHKWAGHRWCTIITHTYTIGLSVDG